MSFNFFGLKINISFGFSSEPSEESKVSPNIERMREGIYTYAAFSNFGGYIVKIDDGDDFSDIILLDHRAKFFLSIDRGFGVFTTVNPPSEGVKYIILCQEFSGWHFQAFHIWKFYNENPRYSRLGNRITDPLELQMKLELG
jgi:hypothetical protein